MHVLAPEDVPVEVEDRLPRGRADVYLHLVVLEPGLAGGLGDEFEHLPHLIRAGDEVVGYATTACDPDSPDNYWIDDIMIAAQHQGKGYGRAAMVEVLKMIVARYPRCEAVQLTCFRTNLNAAALYVSLGFRPTGGVDEEFGEPNYKLTGEALAKFRK